MLPPSNVPLISLSIDEIIDELKLLQLLRKIITANNTSVLLKQTALQVSDDTV